MYVFLCRDKKICQEATGWCCCLSNLVGWLFSPPSSVPYFRCHSRKSLYQILPYFSLLCLARFSCSLVGSEGKASRLLLERWEDLRVEPSETSTTSNVSPPAAEPRETCVKEKRRGKRAKEKGKRPTSTAGLVPRTREHSPGTATSTTGSTERIQPDGRRGQNRE